MQKVNLYENELILIVEDQVEISNYIKNILEKVGVKCVVANDGGEGLILIQKHNVDLSLVLCDIDMPILNGLELIKSILNEKYYVPFVLLTGNIRFSSATEGLRLGVIDYFLKPIDDQDLINKLDLWLEIGRREKYLRNSNKSSVSHLEALFKIKNSNITSKK